MSVKDMRKLMETVNGIIEYDDEHEEEFDVQAEMEDGVIISDKSYLGGYSVGVQGKHIGDFTEWGDVLMAATQWMDQNQYWPNLFYVNDHGNVSLLDQDGNEIRSWV